MTKKFQQKICDRKYVMTTFNTIEVLSSPMRIVHNFKLRTEY